MRLAARTDDKLGYSVLPDGSVQFVLPWPPSVNDYWRVRPNSKGVFYLTKRANQFRDDVWALCIGCPKFGDSPIELAIRLYPPTLQRRDADNFQKAIWDALENAKVFDDDCQVQRFTVEKCRVIKGGCVVVQVRIFDDT